MFKIGLDLGYDYVKGVNELKQQIIFQSIVGQAYQRKLVNLFNDEHFQNDKKNILKNLHVALTYEDSTQQEYFLGDLARREGKNISYAFDDNKINHPNTRALLATATALLLPDNEDVPLHIVTGLPLEQYVHQKNSFKDMIKSLKVVVEFKDYKKLKIVKFNQVTIFPQAAAAVYSAVWHDIEKYIIPGSYIGLIDVGYKTTDYIVFYVSGEGGLILREDLSGTIDHLGMSNLTNVADKLFTQKTGSRLDIPELSLLVSNGNIFYKGQTITFAKELEFAKQELAKVIRDRIKAVWGNKLDFFNTVFIAGGGAKELYIHLKDINTKTELVKNYQTANAEGYLEVAKMIETKVHNVRTY